MFLNAQLVILVLFFIPVVLSAKDAEKNSVGKGNLQFEIKQGELKQVLKAIESQAGIQLHYSILPKKLVTATCSGTTLEVLKCLLGENVNLMYRFSDNSSADDPKNQLSEIWVLDSGSEKNRLPNTLNNSGACDTNENHKRHADAQDVSVGQADQDEINKLLILAQSKDPKFRKEALSRLAAVGQADNGTIRKSFEHGFLDENPNVRAQAVAGMAHPERPGVASMLREALFDEDAGVRLMAVDNAGNDIALLELALSDNDETVRQLAEMKIEQITK